MSNIQDKPEVGQALIELDVSILEKYSIKLMNKHYYNNLIKKVLQPAKTEENHFHRPL